MTDLRHRTQARGLRWTVAPDASQVTTLACAIIIDQLRARPRSVLVLPTGRTPEAMYDCLVAETSPDLWRSAQTFNLDEYVGVPPDHPGSFAHYMRRHLFDPLELPRAQTHVPNGMAAAEATDADAEAACFARACAEYEAALRRHGPADLAIVGVGVNGHIGFNEPGSAFDSRTRIVELSEATRRANAAAFTDDPVPHRAITMGIGTILDARRILLLATGATKRMPIARLAAGEVSEALPVSALHRHDDVTVIVDRDAAADID